MNTAPQASTTAAAGATPPSEYVTASAVVRRHPDDGCNVGEDAQTEAAILAAGIDAERAMGLRQDALQRFAASSCLTDQADADAQLLKAKEAAARMGALILARSPQQVARMEAAKAERMAREPGAERANA